MQCTFRFLENPKISVIAILVSRRTLLLGICYNNIGVVELKKAAKNPIPNNQCPGQLSIELSVCMLRPMSSFRTIADRDRVTP
jgi:hypothetical protein